MCVAEGKVLTLRDVPYDILERREVHVRMMKRAQAAMEFLMTYGWAILVVLAAIGALAYFGVLSPGDLLPEKTTFKAPFLNTESAVVTVSGSDILVQIPFTNGQGGSINIITASGFTGTGNCASPDTLASSVANPISNGAEFILTWTCNNTAGALVAGDKFKTDLSFSYTTSASSLNRIHSGEVTGKLQG
jgi:hypothetical protein